MTAELSTGLIIGGLVGALVALLLIGGLAWWAWRRVKRRVRRAQWLWERGLLRARATVLPRGPRREIVRMRLAIQDNLAQTQRVLSHRAAVDGMPGGVSDLLPRLEHLATGLDEQLRLWETEPDLTLVLDALPELRRRGDTIISHAVTLRATALRRIDEADRLTRSAAEEDLRNQLMGLEAGLGAIRRLPAPQASQIESPPPGSAHQEERSH
jgi:hypothetical protein